LIVVLSGALQLHGAEDSLAEAIRESVGKVTPRLVRIDTIGGYDKIGDELTNEGATTGLLMDTQGHILTSSFNFLHEPSSILVRFHDGVRKIAKVVATDSSRKLTLLKVEVPEESLEAIEPLTPTSPKVGQYVVAVGSALSAEEPNISQGILSGKNRIWGKAIQTDAKISPNNYGGPLLNLQGEILGLCVRLAGMSDEMTAGAEMYDAGVGMAIPIADMLDSFEKLKGGQNLQGGILGLGFGELPLFVGPAIIDAVAKNSPAEKAGLQKGDRIVRIDETTINSAMEATIKFRRKYAGDTIKIMISRGDAPDEIPFEIQMISPEEMKAQSKNRE
jgi:serine protease Do